MPKVSKAQLKQMIASAPPGTSPEGIVAALRERGVEMEGYGKQSAGETMDKFAAIGQAMGYPVPGPKQVLDALPMLGSTAGAMLGGAGGTVAGLGVGGVPGGLAGATLGAAGGEALSQLGGRALGYDAPATPQAAAGQIGVQAGTGLASQLAGEGVARVAAPFARVAMSAALARGGASKLGQRVTTALAERVSVTRQGEKKLMERIGQSAGNTDQLLNDATVQHGFYVDPTHLTMDASRDLMTDPALTQAEKRQVMAWNKEFIQRRSSMTAQELNAVKQRYDAAANPLRVARNEKRQFIPAAEKLRMQWETNMADAARGYLHTVPGVPESMAETGRLASLKDALVPANRRWMGTATRLAGPGIGASIGGMLPAHSPQQRIEHAAIGAVAGAPSVQSTLALLMTNPSLAPFVSNMIRAGVATQPRKGQE